MPFRPVLSSIVSVLFAASLPAQILTIKEPSKPTSTSSSVARKPSADAARALALSFEDAVLRGEREECYALFDLDALIERAAKHIPATEKVKKHFQTGARAAWKSESGLVNTVIDAVAAGGSLRWMHITEIDGATTAFFRLTRTDASAPEYIELALAPRDTKSAIVVDARTSVDAVAHSRVLRRWLLALVADAGRTLPERIAGLDREFALAGRTLETIDLAFEAGRNADALAAWATLPETLRLDPSVVLSRLRAAFAAGGSTFDSALAEVRTAGPTDPAIELFAIDVAMTTNQPERALDAIDALCSAETKDPYLDALRGSILRELGRSDEARTACRRALESDSKLEEAYWTLLGLAIEGERYDEALSLLTRMDQHFDVDWRELADAPAYAGFMASKPGSRWRAKFATSR